MLLQSAKYVLLTILSEANKTRELRVPTLGIESKLDDNDAKFFLMVMRFVRKLYDTPVNEALPPDSRLLDDNGNSTSLREMVAEQFATRLEPTPPKAPSNG